MQNKGTKKPIELVHKPIIRGSWHGKDAVKLIWGRMATVVAITFIYLVACMLLSFEQLWLRVLSSAIIVGTAFYYLYVSGLSQAVNDVQYGEIIYGHREEGKQVKEEDCERSFHPAKGFFVVLAGALPFVLFTLAFAVLAEEVSYNLGVLPSWTESMMMHTEFAAGLAYYSMQPGMGAVDIIRVIVRAMIMPFVNVSSALGNAETLLMERLSPLLILIAPMGYAVGYTRGQHVRDQINTGIKLGDDKKKRREKKARKQRQRAAKKPEQLI